MSNFPSVRPSLNLQFDSQPTPEDMTSHLASVGATFSRASIGTYTDANGLIQEASAGQARPNYSTAGVHEGLLIEESRVNLIKSSEDFSTTDWNKARSFIIVNQAIAPDGTASADKLVESTDTNSHLIYQDVTYTSGVKYTQTVFLKKAEQNFATLFFSSGQGFNANYGLGINLTTGETTATSGLEYSVEDVGNGWFKCSITETTNATSGRSAYIVVQETLTDALVSYAGDGTSGIYIWGAQLEEGSFPTSYIPTIPTFSSRASTATYFDSSGVLQTQAIQTSPTGVGRIDHKYIDGQWVEAGLLLEGASTNLVTSSEDFSGWADTNVTVTANDATAPDGETTATKLTDDATNGQHRIVKSFTTSSSGKATYSIFLKKGTLGTVVLNMFSGSTIANADVNLANGTITKNSGISATIENVDNDWYRCSITGTLANTTTFVYVYMQKTNSISYIGSGDTIFIWGAQLEEQSQPTSYIPTSGDTADRSADVYTTQTKERSADVCYIDGTAFTDFYNQEQGTVFVNVKGVGISGLQGVYDLGASSTNSVDLRFQSNGTYITYVNSSGTAVFVSTSATKNLNSTKLITAYKQDDFVFSADDTNFSNDTSGNIPSAGTKLNIGTIDDNSNFRACIVLAKFIYFPRRLSNTEIQKLTQ